MAKYVVTVPIESVSGWQQFAIEAASEEEAVAKWKKRGGEFLCEDVEITSLDTNAAEASLATEDDLNADN
jgi:hypothetical protein